MPYLDRFDYDIFLSYSWSDNIDEDQGDRKWVEDLKIKLDLELRARRIPASICLDNNTPRNGDTEERFRNYIRRSAIFLAIVTPGFCSEESFCRKEIDWFFDSHRPIAARAIDIDKRVFKIVSRPVPKEGQPKQLRTVSPYTFYEGNPERDGWQAYHVPDVSSINRDGALRITTEYNRLVPALVNFLDRCKQDQSDKPIRTVFIAGTSCPEKEQVTRQIGMHEVVTCTETPGIAEATYIKQIDEALATCDCSIHLIDTKAKLAHPEGWEHSAVENQLLCAQRVEKNNFRALVWCDSTQTIIDQGLNELMARAQGEFPNCGPVKYFPQGIQYFTSNLSGELTRNPRTNSPGPLPPLGNSGKRIFVQCEEADLKKLDPVFDKLSSIGITVQTRPYRGTKAELKTLLKDFLTETNGALVYWGSLSDASAYLFCNTAVHVYGADLDSKKRIIGIDPPNDVQRRRFTHPAFRTIPFPADPEQLTEQLLKDAFL